MKQKSRTTLVVFGALAAVSAVALGIVRGGASKTITADKEPFSFVVDEAVTPDEKGNATIRKRYSDISFSKAALYESGVAEILETGIVYNDTPINSLSKIVVTFDQDSFSAATLYYGNYWLSDEHSVSLSSSGAVDIPDGNSFFVIRSDSGSSKLKSLQIDYWCDPVYEEPAIPVVEIDTRDVDGNTHAINSRTEYVSSKVSVSYPGGEFSNLKNVSAGVKIRGNSTAQAPKKPYRIKFDKKQSVFGLEKNKSWALLADYMDGSNLHNYMALKFAAMVRGEDEFTAHPNHVEVRIDGVSQGLYLLTEQMDEKSGRMNMAQEDGFFTSLFDEDNNFDLNDFPFMIERDASAISDPSEVLDETYFKVTTSNGDVYYSIKYPEKGDFICLDEFGQVQKDELGEAIVDEIKFGLFFEAVRDYVAETEERFLSLKPEDSLSERLGGGIDFDSLASFSLVDLFMYESDHANKSSKLYHRPGGKLMFGPSWDYDSCVMHLPYTGEPIDNPFSKAAIHVWSEAFYLGDRFGSKFWANDEGKLTVESLWLSLSAEAKNGFLNGVVNEARLVSPVAKVDNGIWMQNSSMLFDNVRFSKEWGARRLSVFDLRFSNGIN